MIEFLAFVVLSTLIEAAIITLILSIYTNTSLREAWSWTWSRPWIPVILTIASLLAAF